MRGVRCPSLFKFLVATLLLSLGIISSRAETTAIKLAEDGFPTGRETPEGAACDFARAFSQCDASLFLATCLKPYGAAETSKAYQEYLDTMVGQLHKAEMLSDAMRSGPKSIGKCFAARHLSKDGPASYGYAAFGFQDVMFVDVGVYLYGGKSQLSRTLVVKEKDGQWRVLPKPELSPLLSAGLNEETKSAQDFADAYPAR